MDRIIAPGTVVASSADVAPATGTPGYATDGNPATNVSATLWPAYQYNAFQEELMSIILAGGITPDRMNNGQVLAALKSLFPRYLTFAQIVALTSDIGPIICTDMGGYLYTWQTSAYFTGYRSTVTGVMPPTFMTNPPAWMESMIGGTWSTSDPAQARLIAWFQEQGQTVAAGSWAAATGKIADLGGGNWQAPDVRNMFWRVEGTDADTANPRLIGTWQKGSIAALDIATPGPWSTSVTATDKQSARSQMGYDSGNLGAYSGVNYASASASSSGPIDSNAEGTYGLVRVTNTAVAALILS